MICGNIKKKKEKRKERARCAREEKKKGNENCIANVYIGGNIY